MRSAGGADSGHSDRASAPRDVVVLDNVAHKAYHSKKRISRGIGRRRTDDAGVPEREDTVMDDRLVQLIRSNPTFATLERRRNVLGRSLCVLMLVIYYGFILLIAFAPGLLATPVVTSGVVTLGFPIGIGVILAAILLTGIYVWRANSEFDRLTREIVEATR
jgi:uncharacterized membrane protein (DUF485 family)